MKTTLASSRFVPQAVIAILELILSAWVAHAQFSVSNPALRIWFDDGFGTTDLVGAGATPGPGVPFGPPITAGSGVLVGGNVYPSPPYIYNTPGAATAVGSLAFQVFTYPGGSNYVGVPGAFGAISLTLQQNLPGTAARLRADWTIHYLNGSGNTYSMAPLALLLIAGNVSSFGDYAQVRYQDTFQNINTGASSTVDNLAGGDTLSANYLAGFWHRENTPTLGSFSDNPVAAGTPITINPGDTLREKGFIDVLVDPASINVEVVPEPGVCVLLLAGGLVLIRFSRTRRK